MRYLKALVFYLGISLISILFYCCCDLEYKIIGVFEDTIYSIDFSERYDTIRGPFVIQFLLDAEQVSVFPNTTFITAAFATTCIPDYVNQLDTNNLQISLNRDFVFAQDTLRAGMNLAGIPEINISVEEFKSYELYIFFPEAFIDQSTFQDTSYTFQLELQTDDGLSFSHSIDTYIDL